jgi:hypothetical protein
MVIETWGPDVPGLPEETNDKELYNENTHIPGHNSLIVCAHSSSVGTPE